MEEKEVEGKDAKAVTESKLLTMSAPVKNTCPDIDKVIRKIDEAISISKDGMKANERGDENYRLFDAIESELCGLERELEDLRKANASLREWGEEMVGINEDLAIENEKLTEQLEAAQLITN